MVKKGVLFMTGWRGNGMAKWWNGGTVSLSRLVAGGGLASRRRLPPCRRHGPPLQMRVREKRADIRKPILPVMDDILHP